MSLQLIGENLTVIYILLIILNGIFCYKKMPIIAFPIIGNSTVFLIGVSIDFSAFNVILTLILIVFMIGNFIFNFQDYKR
jgi:hypothetical protein